MKEVFFEAPYPNISFEVESQIIPTHKWLLMQRNKFFANIFSSNISDFLKYNENKGEMSGEQGSKIMINDLKAPTFRGILF